MSEPVGPLPPHHSRGPLLLAMQWGSFGLATVVLFIRLYFRGFVRHNLGWDDLCIGAAWILALYASIAIQEAVVWGYGDHLVYAPDVHKVLFWSTPAEITNTPGVALVKISVCIFVLRLVGKSESLKYVRHIIYANLALLVPASIAITVVLILQCRPLSAVWNELFPPEKCIDRNIIDDLVIFISSINAFTDFVTATLPIFVLSGLQMNRRTKVALCVLVSLAYVVCGIAIGKAVTGATDFSSKDPTYDLIPVAIFSALEHQLGIFLACLPPIAPAITGFHARTVTFVSRIYKRIDTRGSSESYEKQCTTDLTRSASSSVKNQTLGVNGDRPEFKNAGHRDEEMDVGITVTVDTYKDDGSLSSGKRYAT